MKIAFALVFVLFSIVSLVFAVGSLASEPFSSTTIADTGALLVYTVVALVVAALLIYFRDRSMEVLREFDAEKTYRVLNSWQVDGRYVFRVYDYLAGQIRIAEIGSHCPRGFVSVYEDKDNCFFVPDGKKLIFGKAGDFVFTAK